MRYLVDGQSLNSLHSMSYHHYLSVASLQSLGCLLSHFLPSTHCTNHYQHYTRSSFLYPSLKFDLKDDHDPTFEPGTLLHSDCPYRCDINEDLELFPSCYGNYLYNDQFFHKCNIQLGSYSQGSCHPDLF